MDSTKKRRRGQDECDSEYSREWHEFVTEVPSRRFPEVARPLRAVALHASFLALPYTDTNDGKQCCATEVTFRLPWRPCTETKDR